jgi:sialidase-1
MLMTRLFQILLLFFVAIRVPAQVSVFSSGERGYAFFRIPAIIGLRNGDLLAFAEGRVNGSGDFGN